jgi:hypothetical protein
MGGIAGQTAIKMFGTNVACRTQQTNHHSLSPFGQWDITLKRFNFVVALETDSISLVCSFESISYLK